MEMEGGFQNDQFTPEMLLSGKAVSTCLLLAGAFEDPSALSLRGAPKRKQRGPLEH